VARNPTNPPKVNHVAAQDQESGAGSVQFPDIAEMTYEQARDELISIVARLESGQVGLEDSLGLWQRGEALAAHCSTWLDGAEQKLGKVSGS
jgi:exodeoxyribonuclease VII small subunit